MVGGEGRTCDYLDDKKRVRVIQIRSRTRRETIQFRFAFHKRGSRTKSNPGGK